MGEVVFSGLVADVYEGVVHVAEQVLGELVLPPLAPLPLLLVKFGTLI